MVGAATGERYENAWVKTEPCSQSHTFTGAILVVLHHNPMREVPFTPTSRHQSRLAAFSATSASEHLGHTTLPQPRTLRHQQLTSAAFPTFGAKERTPVRRTAAFLAAPHAAGLEGAVQRLRTIFWPRMFH